MSYTPTQWSAGDTVTSAKLNKMEQGIANAGGANILIAHDINGTLDKTWQEIHDADICYIMEELYPPSRTNLIVIKISQYVTNYYVHCILPDTSGASSPEGLSKIKIRNYKTDTTDGYPYAI